MASSTTEPACEPDSLRLVGGTVGKNGRVEVCLNGVWGTICADGWDTSDAFVACKQLGMGYGSKQNEIATKRGNHLFDCMLLQDQLL